MIVYSYTNNLLLCFISIIRIWSLQNSVISIEEFHGRLQEATNFPLRPFVIPFLKVNMMKVFFELQITALSICIFFSGS